MRRRRTGDTAAANSIVCEVWLIAPWRELNGYSVPPVLPGNRIWRHDPTVVITAACNAMKELIHG